MWQKLVDQFASKKLLAVVMAYSLIILSGVGVIEVSNDVLVACSTALTAFIVGQTVVDTKSSE